MSGNPVKMTIHLDRFEEVIGEVHSVARHSVTLLQATELLVYLDDAEIKKWKKLLQKGAKVGILMLEDHMIRVRSIPPKKGKKHV